MVSAVWKDLRVTSPGALGWEHPSGLGYGCAGAGVVREQAPEYGEAARRSEEAADLRPTADAGADADPSVVPESNPDSNPGDSDPNPDPHPNADPDPDALEALEEEITTLAAHLAAAEHRFLALIAEFDRRGGWKAGGHRNCAYWLHERTGMDLRTAYQRLQVARALEELPRTSRAMAEGRISYSQARLIAREGSAESEPALLEVAEHATVSELERFVGEWRVLSRADENALERARFRSRGLKVEPDREGMYRVSGALPAEAGSVVQKALEAAEEALFRGSAREETTPRQQQADALALLAERAMLAGLDVETTPDAEEGLEEESDVESEPEPEGATSGSEVAEGPKDIPDRALKEETAEATRTAAEQATASHSSHNCEPSCECSREHNLQPPAPLTGSRAERFQVFLHVDPTTLADTADPGHSYLEDGVRLAPETTRRLTCDGALVPVASDAEGQVLSVGRRRRTVPPALRRALEVRDGGCCRFPGCQVRHTEPHHIKHWARGGRTELANLISLCRFHHRLVHEDGWKVQMSRNQKVAVFVDPKGRMLPSELPARRRKWLAERARAAERVAAAGDGVGADGNGASATGKGVRSPGAATGHASGDPSVPPDDGECSREHSRNAAEALKAANDRRGAQPQGDALAPRPHADEVRGRVGRIPWELEARAREALDRDLEAGDREIEARDRDLEARDRGVEAPRGDTKPGDHGSKP